MSATRQIVLKMPSDVNAEREYNIEQLMQKLVTNMQTRQNGHHIHRTETLRMRACLVRKTQRALAKLISFDRQADRQTKRGYS
jgi:hypothetical protein